VVEVVRDQIVQVVVEEVVVEVEAGDPLLLFLIQV
jgi:hypothetical protein